MYILGLIGYPGTECHDGAAALVKDGLVIAAAEQERFSRRKHAYGEAPFEAIQFCLDKGGITLDEVDYIASGWASGAHLEKIEPGVDSEYARAVFPKWRFKYNTLPAVYFVKHHIAHITSAFYQSGFREALCLVIDSQGETESTSMAKVVGDQITMLRKYDIKYSLGAFYDAGSKYCGLGFLDAGKLMGLAPYGIPDQNVPLSFDVNKGEFQLNMTLNGCGEDIVRLRQKYIEHFTKNNYPYKSGELTDIMAYTNFAASIQKGLEDIIMNLLTHFQKIQNSENLVISGGVGLNCTVNGIIDRSGLFKNIFIHPGSNDAGCSIGSALELFRHLGIFKKSLPQRITHVYYGNDYTDNEIELVINNRNFKKKKLSRESFSREIAEMLSEGRVLGWFHNGFEFGPRALCARSIIASPCKREILNRINKIKGREIWRPLSPIVLDSSYKDIFEDDNPHNLSDFMLKTCIIKNNWQNKIPAVVHIDRTSRPQIVNERDHLAIYRVIENFLEITGVPVLINTSFNIKGEPIINTPQEALRAVEIDEGIDALIIGNWCVTK